MRLDISVEDGKYRIIQEDSGAVQCLRHGKPWRDLSGDNMVLALAQEIEQLRQRIQDYGEDRANADRYVE